MSYTKIFIHYVWSTKNRESTLVMPYRQLLFDHIKQNALLKDIYLDRINGYLDHVHCLVWLKPMQTIDQVAHLLKGESAHWYNHHVGFKGLKLQWQKNYFAVSVNLAGLEKVRAYIDNQETHHRTKTFEEEYNEFLKNYLMNIELENSSDRFRLNTG